MAQKYTDIEEYRKENELHDPARSTSFEKYIKGLSKNNPYLSSLYNSRNSVFTDVLQKAIQWESDQFGVRQEMSYNSESAQVARERAAGLNPDLLRSSGGSGSGSSSALDVPVTDMGGASTGAQNVQADASMVNSIGSTVNQSISTLTDSFATITGAVQSIKDFQNQFSFNQAQARIASAQAGVSESLADNELLMSNLTNSRLLAEMYPYSKADDGTAIIPTLDEVTKFLSDYGIDDPKKAGMVHNYMKNPSMMSHLDALMEESSKNHASAQQRTYEYYNALFKRQGEVNLLKTDTDFYLSSIQSTLQSVLSGDDSYIQNLISQQKQGALAESLGASNDVSEQRNRSASLKFIRDMLKHDHRAFKNGLESVNIAVKSLDKKIEDVRNSPAGKSSWGKSMISQLYAERNLMTTLGSTQLHRYTSIYTDALRKIEVNKVFHGIPVVPDKDGKTSDLITKRMGIISYTFDHFMENPTSFDNWFSPLMYGLGSAIGFAGQVYSGKKGLETPSFTPQGWTTSY